MRRLCLLLLPSHAVLAGERASADYSLPAESLTSAGGSVSSVSYKVDAELNDAGGQFAEDDSVWKGGFPGQLYDPVQLDIAITPGSVPEESTAQLSAMLTMDDATTQPVMPQWQQRPGAIVSISPSGLLLAEAVPAEATATVEATLGEFHATLEFPVLDSLPDNFGLYAGDGLPDAWQINYFGIGNPAAAPNADPDYDGQSNLFEFNACLTPTDGSSRVELWFSGPGAITLSPVFPDCRYTLQSSTGMAEESWHDVLTAPPAINGLERTWRVPVAEGAGRNFYRVQISRLNF